MFQITTQTQEEIRKTQTYVDLCGNDAINSIREKRPVRATPPIPFRVLDSWITYGIIDDCRSEKGKDWHNFSTIDLIFITILIELQKFGASIKRLSIIKSFLFLPSNPDNQNGMTRLEFAYIRSQISDNGNTYILIDDLGNAQIATEQDISINKISGIMPASYVLLNLNKILARHIKDQDVWQELSVFLHRNELKLISTIRNTDAKEYKIKVNDNREVTWIERGFSGKPQDVDSLHNLINQTGYGQIQLTIKDGKVCYLQGVTQEKI